ncbi:hypothetical protein SLEP1_g27869 [Rubroshorea leprosula]|uniref:DUF4220 domain-containing protein n=1 Tax=Rubroshorea leprosula TaxID=152421 RepID=A0AAV5K155_9ROSI|nr:hypothetical protein SLEP1_g27869 [Rubroshorea leprosula]
MAGSGKSSSIVSAFSTLLLEAWEKWDVRGMVLLSLTLQIVLSVLGKIRKYKINPFFKTILWLSFLGADWIALATLGKLSGSYTESPATNALRANWAPLLLLHLGGPDTITAYSFEDNKLWIRHLFILLVKVIFVIYVICLTWTFTWLSFLSFPLILAGITKYVEKILCLKLNNSQKTKSVISSIFNFQSRSHFNWNQTLNHLPMENPAVLVGYLLFTIMRPDVNDYLSSHSTVSYTKLRIKTYVEETTEFIFDVVYTKVVLIYTKLGCLLRLTSFASSLSVLLLFFISIINEPKFHFSRVDLVITGVLLAGTITLELYAAWVMLSSDWAILVAEFHHNLLVRKMFKATLKCFSHLLRPSKRWSEHIGQFDLLEYCWLYKKKKVNCILRNITSDGYIIEMWHKYSIIVWHIATSVCYLQKDHDDDEANVCHLAVKISKEVSDYMMYLLAMCPTLILPDHSRSFWLDHTYDKLKELLRSATTLTDAASKLVPVHEEDLEATPSALVPDNVHEEDLESRETTFEDILQKDVSKLARLLKKSKNKWELIRDVWIEMLVYAAISSQHISHVKQLGEGIEFLSLIWLFVGLNVVFDSVSV